MTTQAFNTLVLKYGTELATKAFNWFTFPGPEQKMRRAIKGKDQAEFCIKCEALWNK